MISVKIQTEGMAETEAALEAFCEGMMPKITGVLQEGMEGIAREARALVPAESGQLKESIRARVRASGEEAVGEVTVTAEHGAYVEMGTSRMPARPFLYPAYMAGKEKMISALKRAVGGKD